MKTMVLGAATALALAAAVAAAGVGVGDRAPLPEVKETLNLPGFAVKDLEGKVVLYEIFRTW